MADAVLAFKQAIQASEPVEPIKDGIECSSLAKASHIRFSSELTAPKTEKTRFRRGADGFYTLEAVYLVWKLRDAQAGDYLRRVREQGVATGFVGITERKLMVEWLEGKTSEHQGLEPLEGEATTPPGTPPASVSATLPALGATPSGSGAASGSTAVKRRYVPDAADLEAVKKIRANEIELRDRNSALRGEKTNNFSAVRAVFSEKLKKIRENAKTGSSAQAAPTKPDPKAAARKARNMHPIIIVSSSPTALITMHNVKRFLQDAEFETSSDARQRSLAEGNTRTEDVIAVDRSRTHIEPGGRETKTKTRYFVVDSVEALNKFGHEAWDRVVCVMTTGQAWQFKPYKWSEPRQLFHNVKGVYFQWANDPPNMKIHDWNVEQLKIDQQRRHVDKSVVAHFWKILDAWTMVNKPYLAQR